MASTTGNVEEGEVKSTVAKKPSVRDDHWLKTTQAGESQIEHLAHRIEGRRADRILVTFSFRVELLQTCRDLCKRKEYAANNKITLHDLKALHAKAKAEVEADAQSMHLMRFLLRRMGFRYNALLMLEVTQKAINVVNEAQMDHDDWFYFQDFSFYYTKVESKWPWLRHGSCVAFLIVFCYYLFTVILFCHIVGDEGICPDDPTDQNRSYYGWLSSLYFASTTISTVGYGDLSVSKDDRWGLLVGVVYMIISILVAILAFSALADQAFSNLSGPMGGSLQAFCGWMIGDLFNGEHMHQRIRRVNFTIMAEIIIQFTLLNLVGVFVSRYFANRSDTEKEQWSWMTSLYWAVQTTTTIGYGDLDMSFDLRWFQIFYLTLSTYFVGDALGKLASLRTTIEQIRRRCAWERREVSKEMLKDMQSHDSGSDDRIDQYEFAIASLLTLGTVSASDLEPIMEKYRQLAGDTGYIEISEAVKMVVDEAPPSAWK